MILPIVAYGDTILRKKTKAIGKDYPDLDLLIGNMFETMYNALGVGLAAPQIGLAIRLFIVDLSPFAEDEKRTEEERKQLSTFKKVFINPKITNETGPEWLFNEGCLSIPDIREDISRNETITIEYYDAQFKKHTGQYNGLIARVIQHEYDHLEGILFTDKLSGLKKRLLKGKLANISKGKIKVTYKMRFPGIKK